MILSRPEPRSLALSLLLLCLCLALSLLSVVDPATAAGKNKNKKGKVPEPTEEPIDSSEYLCEADIYYTWERTSHRDSQTNEDASKKPASTRGEPSTQDVFYVRAGERGIGRQRVKDTLAKRASAIKAAALRECEQLHQEESLCIAQQLKRASSNFQMLGFEARRTLVNAVEKDCASKAGRCVSAKLDAISCYKTSNDSTEEKGKPKSKR